MSDKVYNFFNCCEHPRIIKNKYTGEPVYVKCGVCPHCLISRSDAKRNLCDYEKSNRKYCYFVTLTYNSQYVPKMALIPIEDYEFDYPVGKVWPAVRSQLLTRMLLDPRFKENLSPGIVKYHLTGRSSPDFAENATLEDKSNAERLG